MKYVMILAALTMMTSVDVAAQTNNRTYETQLGTVDGGGVRAVPQVEKIKAKRLQEVERLPDYYKGALTDELEEELRTNADMYREFNQNPDLTKALYTRRDLQRALARGQITVEQVSERIMPNIKAHQEAQKKLEELRREKEASPVNRLQQGGNVRYAPRRIGGGGVNSGGSTHSTQAQ